MKFRVAVVITGLFCAACQDKATQEESLAKTYCGSCHVFTEPGLLDKKTWEEKVLPEMAFRMGLDFSRLSNVPGNDLPVVLPAFPDKAMVTQEEWELIKNYYSRMAPDTIVLPEADPPLVLTQFEVEPIVLEKNSNAMLTMLKADTIGNRLYTSNRAAWLHQYNFQFQLLDSIRLSSPAAHLLRYGSENTLILQMGIMDPNDQSKGALVNIRGKQVYTIIDSLKRPVFFEMEDMNGDGLEDFIICSFGNFTGDLSVFENLGEGQFKKHVLTTLPGARNTVIRDINNDGLPDILALITQGDEQITAFINQGDFKFKTQILLRFPPVYGSSYFEVADFNNDGEFDLLYTNGDNADYSAILKPYHGVRIFLNQGKNTFKESWFYPMPGCFQAIARDFDQDGDYDIAAISFFPNFKNGADKSFLYFENVNGEFKVYTTPVSSSSRWLLMESLDVDEDGDEDVLIGAFDLGSGVPPEVFAGWKANPVSLLLLRNNQRR